jgi:macrolide transport system ATP-binding/permease protein
VRDVWFSLRQLVRAPAFATTAIVTLALGTGANTATFGLLNDLLRPLPVPHADRIVVIAAGSPSDETGLRYRYSFPALVDYRQESGVFSDVFGFDTRIGGLTIHGTTSQFTFHAVTGNFFSGLGVTPAAGRLLAPGEGEQAGSDHVIVLGYDFWRARLGGDPHAVGSTVRLDGQPARIVGVTAEGFHGLFAGLDVDGYVPLNAQNTDAHDTDRLLHDRAFHSLTMAARLRPGVSIGTAQGAAAALQSRLGTMYPPTDGHTTVRILPEPLARPVPLPFLARVLPVLKFLLFVLAALVLLIACLNVANLMLVRMTVRQREMAVRASLGAGRARLVRLLLSESLVLAVPGGALGLVVGQTAIRLVVGSLDIAVNVPVHFDTPIDWPLFSYALATAVAAAALVGVLPAIRASRAAVTDLLHDGSRGQSGGAGRQRLRGALVVAQVAGSLVLLVMAGLAARNLQAAQWIDLGFDPSNVLTLQLNPHDVGYTSARASAFYDELQRRLRALPGVESVSTAFVVPLGYVFGSAPVFVEGRTPRGDEPPAPVGYDAVSPSYFETMRLPIVRGRPFTEQDSEGATRVAIVNGTLASRLWPDEDAIGKRFATLEAGGPLWQVVGISQNSKYIAVFEAPLPYFYLPQAQNATMLRTVALRSDRSPDVLGSAVEREITALDPEIPVAGMRTMRQVIDGGFGFLLVKIGATEATGLGLVGLLLAMVGVYGIVSYGASQRAREIGIRLALGAQPGHVRRLVLGQGAALVAVGLVIGFVLTVAATQAVAKTLLLVSATDPLAFGGVTAGLALVALVACYVPARRVTRVDPMVALRHE